MFSIFLMSSVFICECCKALSDMLSAIVHPLIISEIIMTGLGYFHFELYVGKCHPLSPGPFDYLSSKSTVEMIEVCCPHSSSVCPLPITSRAIAQSPFISCLSLQQSPTEPPYTPMSATAILVLWTPTTYLLCSLPCAESVYLEKSLSLEWIVKNTCSASRFFFSCFWESDKTILLYSSLTTFDHMYLCVPAV